MSVNSDNSLGTFEVIHQPLLFEGILKTGMISKCEHIPPKGNPTYQYYFPKNEEGYVDMNFTVNVTHRLNDPNIAYFSKLIWPDSFRFTCVKLWINVGGEDRIINWTQTICGKFYFVNYTLVLADGLPLKTNNETKQGVFWWQVWPGPQPNPWFNKNIMPLLPEGITGITAGHNDIYINPIN